MKKRLVSTIVFLLGAGIVFSTVNDTNTSKYFKIEGA